MRRQLAHVLPGRRIERGALIRNRDVSRRSPLRVTAMSMRVSITSFSTNTNCTRPAALQP